VAATGRVSGSIMGSTPRQANVRHNVIFVSKKYLVIVTAADLVAGVTQ
jgi:hypothetical protein